MTEVLQGERAPVIVAPPPPKEGQLRFVEVWHALGAVACVVALWAAMSPSGRDLPTVIRVTLLVFFGAALVGQVLSIVGVRATKRWSRPLSLAVNYLVAVVAIITVLNRIDFFGGFSTFASGFAQGIWLLVVGVIGALWWWVANRIASRSPDSRAVVWLRRAGQALVAVAGLCLFVYGLIGWLGHLDPEFAADPRWSGDLGQGLAELVRRLLSPLTLAAAGVAAGSIVAFRIMWAPGMAVRFGTTNAQSEAIAGWLFLSPNILGFLIFFAGPLLFSLLISFFNWDALGQNQTWAGLDNYARILALDLAKTAEGNARAAEVLKPGYLELMHLDWFGQHWLLGARDRVFWLSLRNIVIFLVLAVPLSVIPALFLSTILNSKLRGVKLFRAVFFIPSVAGVIGVTLIWRDLFNATVGWINYLLTRAGEVLPFIPDPETPVQQPWLTSSGTALVCIVVVFAWMTFGFNTVLYLAGHQAIPNDLYEAAELDGANAWKRFRRITVPQLRNTTFYVVATTSILAMQLFDIVWVLTNPPGSPDNATQTPVLHLYNMGFQESRQGYASAVAWVLFVLIFGLTIIQFRRQQEQVGA